MPLIFILASFFFFIIYKILYRIQYLKSVDEAVALYTQYIQLAKTNQLDIWDYLIKLKGSVRESMLIESNQVSLIEEIEYYLKYYYKCPSCSHITDVSKSEHNNVCHEERYLSNGRYTKDGTLDERYNTEFDYILTYFFEAKCENCGKKFKVQLSDSQHKYRCRLMGENEGKDYVVISV